MKKIARIFLYTAEEASHYLWTHRVMCAVAVITIAVSFFIFGSALLVRQNAVHNMESWLSESEILVFLKEEFSREDFKKFIDETGADIVVKNARYISKESAVKNFLAHYPGLEESVEMLGKNPLPPAIALTLSATHAEISQVREIAKKIKSDDRVLDVRYDAVRVERITKILKLFKALTLPISTILFLATAFTLFCVARLTAYARINEMAIMKLVGASSALIKLPFALETILSSVAGAVLGLGALYALWRIVKIWLPHIQIAQGLAFSFLSADSLLLIFGLAVFAGLVSALLALKKF